MAARTRRPNHTDSCREKIQASQLINRLQDHALNGTALEKSQIDAIKILLSKTLPDLQAVSHSGDEDNPIAHSVTVNYIDPNTNPDSV